MPEKLMPPNLEESSIGDMSRRKFLGSAAAVVFGAAIEMAAINTGVIEAVAKWGNQAEKELEYLSEPEIIESLFGKQIDKQLEAHIAAEKPTNEFLTENAELFRGKSIGASFSPERVFPDEGLSLNTYLEEGQTYNDADELGPEHQKVQRALSILQFAVESLGIKDIRFGIRQDNAITSGGKLDLSLYKPFLDYMTENGVNITLNVGPIKTFGWPETHIPNYGLTSARANKATGGQAPSRPNTDWPLDKTLLPTGKLPPAGSMIKPNMQGYDLPQKSLAYLDTLLDELRRQYPGLKSFQLDNEPLNYAGTEQYVMSKGLEGEFAKKVWQRFPDADLTINSIGTFGDFDLKNAQISLAALESLEETITDKPILIKKLELAKYLQRINPGKGKIRLGEDCYHLSPDSPPPVKRTVNGKAYLIYVDTISLVERLSQQSGIYNPWDMLHSEKIPMTITEMQAEPWGNVTEPGEKPGDEPGEKPGDNPEEFRYMLLRSAGILPRMQAGVINMWGLEYMGQYLTSYPYFVSPEHQEIMLTGALMNGKSQSEFDEALASFIGRERVADYAARQTSIGL